MTFSIVATDGSGSWGVAVASKFLAVGAAVPAVRAEVGAIATQAMANLRFGPEGIALLENGLDAHTVAETLMAADAQREHRQLGVVDANGGSASLTGASCMAWAGGVTGPGYAIQGNILAGEEVVLEMERAWLAGSSMPIAARLIDVLRAGDAAGGDRRGRQSAALVVGRRGAGYGGGSDIAIDLRVDDHQHPIPELARLLEIHELLFGTPTETIPLEGEHAERLRSALDALGYTNPDLEAALFACAGVENLEERLVPGRLDPVVLTYLEGVVATRHN